MVMPDWAHFFSKTFGMPSGPMEVEPFKVLRIRVTISGVKTTLSIWVLVRIQKSGVFSSSDVNTLAK